MELCVEKKVTREPILALASVSGLHTMAVIGSGILHNWGDWGTMIALIAIGAVLGLSVYWTIKGDIGYLVEAFT